MSSGSTSVFSSTSASRPLSAKQSQPNSASQSLSSANKQAESPRSLHVNFNTENPDLSERKKKYLTAKYGQHQMNLIKKRLRVEMWMYEQLQILYATEVSAYKI